MRPHAPCNPVPQASYDPMPQAPCVQGSLTQAIQLGIFKPTNKWGPKLALRALLRTAREVAQGMVSED